MKRLKLIVALLVVLPISLFALQFEKHIVHPIDMMGAGDAGVASYGKFGMIFMNPAALGVTYDVDPKYMDIPLLLKIGVNGDFLQILNEGLTAYTQSSNFSDPAALLTSDWLRKFFTLNPNVGIDGPVSLGYIGNKIGIIFHSEHEVGVGVDQNGVLPNLRIGAYADQGIIFAFGSEIPMPIYLGKFTRVYAGINLSVLNRFKLAEDRVDPLYFGDYVMGIQNGTRGILQGINVGSDIGLMAVMNKEFIGSLLLRDVFGTGFSWTEYSINGFTPITNILHEKTHFPVSVDLGVSYIPLMFSGPGLMSDVRTYFDIVNSLDFSENYWLKFRLGAEAKFFGFLRLQLGLYDGYPTYGFIIDAPVFKMSFSYYNEELGIMPGLEREEHFMFDISLIL